MRNSKKLLSAIVLALLLAIPCIHSMATEEAKTLDIMFLHDTHSHLNEFATVEDGKTQVLGGFAKIKTLMNEQLEENPDTLFVDGGDFSMGTLVQVVYEEEASEIRMLGEIGISATTLGNHEFDYKAKGLANMLKNAMASGDKLPEMLVCNIDWESMEAKGLTEDQKLLKEAFESYGMKDYTIIEKGDVKIALIGVFGMDALACVPNCPIEFKDPIAAVQETVADIKANEEVDMIACISHSGTWEDPEKSEDELLAKAESINLDNHEYENFRKEIMTKKTMV